MLLFQFKYIEPLIGLLISFFIFNLMIELLIKGSTGILQNFYHYVLQGWEPDINKISMYTALRSSTPLLSAPAQLALEYQFQKFLATVLTRCSVTYIVCSF